MLFQLIEESRLVVIAICMIIIYYGMTQCKNGVKICAIGAGVVGILAIVLLSGSGFPGQQQVGGRFNNYYDDSYGGNEKLDELLKKYLPDKYDKPSSTGANGGIPLYGGSATKMNIMDNVEEDE
jgi:hypothetical protein